MTDVVNMMGGFIYQTESPYEIASIKSGLAKRDAELVAEAVANSRDWGDFERRRGRVEGLRDATGIVEGVLKKKERDVR
jgi:hypothetical protein